MTSIKWAIRAALVAAVTATPALSASVTSFVNLGGYRPDEMTIDRATGDVFLTVYASGSTKVSIVKATAGNLTTVYASLPGTTGGDLEWADPSTLGSALEGRREL